MNALKLYLAPLTDLMRTLQEDYPALSLTFGFPEEDRNGKCLRVAGSMTLFPLDKDVGDRSLRSYSLNAFISKDPSSGLDDLLNISEDEEDRQDGYFGTFRLTDSVAIANLVREVKNVAVKEQVTTPGPEGPGFCRRSPHPRRFRTFVTDARQAVA